jgi:hypothetical protein
MQIESQSKHGEMIRHYQKPKGMKENEKPN